MLHSFRAHKGVKLLERPHGMLRKVPLADVVAHNMVRNPRRRQALDAHISDYYWHRRMINGFAIKTILAEVEKPKQKKTYLTTRGNAILNGASGTRARNDLGKTFEFSEERIDYFRKTYCDLVDPSSIKLYASPTKKFWIESKNYHNFFHFLTESFHLAFSSSLAQMNVQEIKFISKSKRVGDFVKKWVEECQEIIGDDVKIETLISPDLDNATSILLPMSCEHLLYQFLGDHHELIEAARPAGKTWTGYDGIPHPVKILQFNSYDESLEHFRCKVIDLAQRKVSKTWADKIYAIRSKSLLRSRTMKGEEALIEELTKQGFEVVCFEGISPLEQVKCISGADCVVMQHGAGMTNMLFAKSTAHVFELGTFQTGFARWRDFIRISQVSGCHYHHIFLDMEYPNENTDPVFATDGLIAPVISEEDVERLVLLIRSEMKDKRPGVLTGLLRHCEFFMDRGAYKHAYRLLDANASFFESTADYWNQRGMLAEACQHKEQALDAFEKAQSIRVCGDSQCGTDILAPSFAHERTVV
ncbi:glycosyltransferase family 61 protein (plasmid) [Paracoccus liaowanqingii]|uniref:Glycosyltransferase family 61 protein n=1 Tax=Paracoccus liaowanqingii TaxID=2560053 RepID=A0A4Y5SQD7_9RHOB|nr:glycosyltransferase family 61 protein [Paracoccus liaowanqingii]